MKQIEWHQMILNDINNHIFEQEKKPLNVALRQTQVMVECEMVSGSKRMQSCLGLQFDMRVGNMNRQIGECNNDIGLGCWCASWEGEGEV